MAAKCFSGRGVRLDNLHSSPSKVRFGWKADIARLLRLVDGGKMGTEITIDPLTGILGLGDARLRPLQSKSEVEPQIAQLLQGSRDHGNGYEWLYLSGLTFGRRPASAGLCFHAGRLEQASWNVQLVDAPMESGWPTREAIDEEIAFVRGILARGGLNIGDNPKKFHWGEAWSSFDAKGFLASNGLRYRTS